MIILSFPPCSPPFFLNFFVQFIISISISSKLLLHCVRTTRPQRREMRWKHALITRTLSQHRMPTNRPPVSECERHSTTLTCEHKCSHFANAIICPIRSPFSLSPPPPPPPPLLFSFSFFIPFSTMCSNSPTITRMHTLAHLLHRFFTAHQIVYFVLNQLVCRSCIDADPDNLTVYASMVFRHKQGDKKKCLECV